MRIPINKVIDLSTLTEQLTALLRHHVALSARMPGQFDDKGDPLPGVLLVLDAGTGEPLDLTSDQVTTIEKAIAEHVPPPPPKTPAKSLVEQLTTVTTVASLKTVLTEYAAALVRQEDSRPIRSV